MHKITFTFTSSTGKLGFVIDQREKFEKSF